MHRHATAIAALFVVTAPCCAIAANLDAPAAKPVTIKTEIKRGVDLTLNCAIDNAGEWLNFAGCVSDGMDKNQQANTDTEAFKLGVYWESVKSLEIKRNADKKYRKIDLRDNKTFFNIENAYLKLYRDSESKMGINDQDICTATGAPHPEACKPLILDP